MGKIHYLMESLSIDLTYDQPLSETPGLIKWIKDTGTSGRFSNLRYHFKYQNMGVFGYRNGYLQELHKKLTADEMMPGHKLYEYSGDWNMSFDVKFQPSERKLATYFKISYG